MSGASVTAQIDLRGFEAAMRGLVRLGRDTTPLMRTIGVGLVRNTQDRMDAQQAPDGSAWAPLLPAYAAIKRGPGILRAAGMRGGLQGSITFDASRNSVAVGSNKIYARVHQEGATIVPKNAKRLRFALAGGIVFSRQVTIPARPYLGISVIDEDTILDASEVILARAIAGRR